MKARLIPQDRQRTGENEYIAPTGLPQEPPGKAASRTGRKLALVPFDFEQTSLLVAKDSNPFTPAPITTALRELQDHDLDCSLSMHDPIMKITSRNK